MKRLNFEYSSWSHFPFGSDRFFTSTSSLFSHPSQQTNGNESSILSLLEWVRFTDEFRRSRWPVVLIHTVFPHSVVFRVHSPPACVDQLQEGLSFGADADHTTNDGHISPMAVGTGQGLMVLHDKPIPPSFVIAGAGRKLWTVLLIKGAILDVQPEVSLLHFLRHDDSPQNDKPISITLGRGGQP